MELIVRSLKDKVLLTIKGNHRYFLERKSKDSDEWARLYANIGRADALESVIWLTSDEYTAGDFGASKEAVTFGEGDIVDSFGLKDTLYTYHATDATGNALTKENTKTNKPYTHYVRTGETGGYGYSFGNYKVAEGFWGDIAAPDYIRYTYLWGTDFKANNGASFTDEQIQYYIDGALVKIERLLNIDIKKRRYRSAKDTTDKHEALYDYARELIQKYAILKTRHRWLEIDENSAKAQKPF